MMNQTKKHTTGKKLLALLLALIMTVSLLPMSVFAAEPGAEETPVVEGQTQPAAETGADDADQAQESDADSGEEDADVTDDAESDADAADDGIAAFAATDATTNQLTFTAKNGYSYVALATDTSALPTTDSSNPYRIVMLDCGRKYFTVQQIKTLIDTMAQYKYNQLQLSFGNGGCRLLLNDMNLTYVKDTLTTEYVQTQIKEGNKKFNGNENCLTQDEMSAIIAYAKGKNIEIIPMLNMPGHAKAIDYVISCETDDILNTSNNTVREFAFALLKKYVDYFKGQGCKYFHFGSDESKESGTNMSTFLASCANIIANAGLRPRAFNDETALTTTSDANVPPKFVQITYWIQYSSNNSKSANTLNTDDYQLINTHGNWYYVVNDGKAETGKSNQFKDNVRVELPLLKKNGTIYAATWPQSVNNFYDNMYGQGSNVTGDNYKGTMFCIWCDNSTEMPGDAIISTDKNYGALYQIQELAKHYWGDEITSGGDTGDTEKTENVKLEVGQSSDPYEVTGTVTEGEQITDNNKYIATATVTDGGTAQAASVDKVTTFKSGNKYLITMSYKNVDYVVTNEPSTTNAFGAKGMKIQALDATAVDSLKPYLWTITETTGNYCTVVDAGGKYLSINGNNDVTLASSAVELWKADYSDTEAIKVGLRNKTSNIYLDNFGGAGHGSYNTLASGYSHNSQVDNITWTLYEITEATTGGNTLTITGTGEGNTEVTVGNTKYIIEVTAPTKTETVSIVPKGTTTLVTAPEGGSVEYTLSAENNTANVTLDASTGVVTASEKTGTATVTAVVKNAGEKVVARYTYTITVSAIDFSNASKLPVELWVTNLPIGQDETVDGSWNGLSINKSGSTTYCDPATIKINAQTIYADGGLNGVELSSQVPDSGVSYGGNDDKTVNKDPDGSNTVYLFWKGVVLHNGLKQYHANGPETDKEDKSGAGTDFKMIRYTETGWQYCDTNDEWHDVISGDNGDTLIAYYMQKFVVSKEITTLTRDWGKAPSGEGIPNWSVKPLGFMGTGFAVVYPGGQISRTEDEIYSNMTVRYAAKDGSTTPGIIAARNNSDYVIEKITITRGTNQNITDSNKAWNTTDTIEWDKITRDDGTLWYNETVLWEADETNSVSTPTVNVEELSETDANGGWYAKKGNEAFLILIYLKARPRDTNLNVVYWDDNAKKQINKKDVQIVVEEGKTYKNDLFDPDGTLIGNLGPWPGKTAGDADYLSDDAYVTNKSGAAEKINKYLPSVPNIDSIYKSGIYEYVGANIAADDDKTLILHYDLKATDGVTYVVDFGLPIQIPFSAYNIEDLGTDVDISFSAADRTLVEKDGQYGHGSIDKEAKIVTYTLTETIDNKVAIPVYLFAGNNDPIQRAVYVIPASNVYYEDSFVNFTKADGNRIVGWSIVNDNDQVLDTAPESSVPQALETLNEKQNVYGYDIAYDNCTKFSMGTAMKTTVYGDKYALADFTFKGTGFDIISLTSNRSGTMIVTVTGADKNNAGFKKNYMVDTYYGYAYEGDQWVVKENDPNTLYQIPVMKVTGLEYGTYKATVTVAYNEIFDHAAADSNGYGTYDFYLDAVRVYEPLGPDGNDYYKGDGEGWPQYIEIRDQLITNKTFDGEKGVVFIDGKEKADIQDYTSYGPNNEVYLLPNQSIAFKLSSVENVDAVHIGAKAPMETGSAKLIVNGRDVTPNGLTTATEMYYDITDEAKSRIVTITNTGDEGKILSLTNVKVTFKSDPGTKKVTLPMDETTAQAAVAMVRAMYAPVPVVPEVFEPERFEASWNRSTVKVGQKATLTVKTSTDVDAITVDGVIVTNYRTRTQRTGWGWNATKVTYREFTYTITAAEAGTLDYSVAAVNADGVSSEPITAMLTVQAVQRPQRPGWLDKLFSRWF